MTRHTAFRFRLELTSVQEALLRRHAGAARFAYNQSLRLVKDALDHRALDPTVRVPWTEFDPINAINTWKRSPAAGVTPQGQVGLPWRNEVASQVLEEGARDVGRALVAFTRSRGARTGRQGGFPKFKRKGRSRDAFRLRAQNTNGRCSIRVGEGHPRSVRLPRLGVLRVREDTRRVRRLLRGGRDGDRARISFVTVNRSGDHWYLTLNLRAPDLHPARRHPRSLLPAEPGFVGVDLGIRSFAVVADARGGCRERITGPRLLNRAQRKLRREHRSVDRKRRGSSNRARAGIRLGRTYQRITQSRKHFLHETSTHLVKTHDRLCVEDLDSAGLLRNRHIARHVQDAAWGRFVSHLRYKAVWYGCDLVAADRWFPSSKLCSRCGTKALELPPTATTYRCALCGAVLHRDFNAAVNLAAWADSQAVVVKHTETTNARGGGGAGAELVDAKPPPSKREPSLFAR